MAKYIVYASIKAAIEVEADDTMDARDQLEAKDNLFDLICDHGSIEVSDVVDELGGDDEA